MGHQLLLIRTGTFDGEWKYRISCGHCLFVGYAYTYDEAAQIRADHRNSVVSRPVKAVEEDEFEDFDATDAEEEEEEFEEF